MKRTLGLLVSLIAIGLSLQNLAHSQEIVQSGYVGTQITETGDGRVWLTGIVEGSPASQAGLQSGDELLYLNQKRIRSVSEAKELISSFKAGESIELTVVRAGALKKQTVTLGRRPSSVENMTNNGSSPLVAQAPTQPPKRVETPNQANKLPLAVLPSESASKARSFSSELATSVAKTVSAYIQSQEAILNGARLSRTEMLADSQLPDTLRSRIQALTQIPADEAIECVQIAEDWRSSNGGTYRPHSLAVFTSDAVHFGVIGDQGLKIERVTYKELHTQVKFNYSRFAGDEGKVTFANGRVITTSSEAARMLHVVTNVISENAAEKVRSAIVAQRTLPDADIRAIKGFGSVRWDCPKADAMGLLAVNLDKSAVVADHANKTPDEVVSEWAHYNQFYPGIKLSPPLTSVQYSDRSGKVLLHFLNDKLQVVERHVSEAIRVHSNDALGNMLTKYGPARREVCDFRMDNGGDRIVRFVWETEHGRVIALCDAWYPAVRLGNKLDLKGNEMKISCKLIGGSAVFRKNSENDSGYYERATAGDLSDPTLRQTNGRFVQVSFELENKSPNLPWTFDAPFIIKLVDQNDMKDLGAYESLTGPRMAHSIPPNQVTGAHPQNRQTHRYLFDLPTDKLPNTPTFFRLEVSSVGEDTIYSDFYIANRVEPVESLFETLRPLQSEVVTELVPPNMRIALRSIAYNSKSLTQSAAQIDAGAAKAREDAAKREEFERAKIKKQSLKDL